MKTLTPPAPSKQEVMFDVTQPVERVVTLHVLRGGGEGGAAGVLMDFPRSHDRELSCKHPRHQAGQNSQSQLYKRSRDQRSVPTTPGPWTSSTLPSEVVIFQ